LARPRRGGTPPGGAAPGSPPAQTDGARSSGRRSRASERWSQRRRAMAAHESAALLRARAGVGARAGAREHRRRGHRTHALCDDLGEGPQGRAGAQTVGRLPRGASPVGRHPSAWVASGPLGERTGGNVGGRARRLALRQLPASIHRAFGPAVPPPRSGPRPEPLLLPAQSAASPPPSGYGSVGTWRIGATPEPRPGRTRRPSGPQRAVPAPGTPDAARRPHDQARSRRGHDLPRADGRWEAALWADGRRRAAGPAAPRAGSHAVWATGQVWAGPQSVQANSCRQGDQRHVATRSP
jgi:hypothetical protein